MGRFRFRRERWLGAAILVLAATGAAAGDYTGNVNFLLGTKTLDDGDWEPVESQGEFGALISWGRVAWPVQIAIDLLASTKEETSSYYDPYLGYLSGTLEGSTAELGVGVRKVWGKDGSKVRPFLSGGLLMANAELKVTALGVSASVDDDAAGLWVDGGVWWRLGERFKLGLEARCSTAEVEMAGYEVSAGGLHLGALIGFGW